MSASKIIMAEMQIGFVSLQPAPHQLNYPPPRLLKRRGCLATRAQVYRITGLWLAKTRGLSTALGTSFRNASPLILRRACNQTNLGTLLELRVVTMTALALGRIASQMRTLKKQTSFANP